VRGSAASGRILRDGLPRGRIARDHGHGRRYCRPAHRGVRPGTSPQRHDRDEQAERGHPERRVRHGEAEDEERLAGALHGVSGAPQAIEAIRGALEGFERGAQADDTAVVAVQRLPAPVRTPAAAGEDVTSGAG